MSLSTATTAARSFASATDVAFRSVLKTLPLNFGEASLTLGSDDATRRKCTLRILRNRLRVKSTQLNRGSHLDEGPVNRLSAALESDSP